MKTQLCNCLTKTPDWRHHEEDCPVYLEGRVNYLETLMDEQVHNFVVRRETTTKEAFDYVESLKAAILKRLERHGYGIAVSPHEVLGIILEEVDELIDEVRGNDLQNQYDELVDIAIAAVFGMISIQKRIEFNRGDNR